MKGRGDVAFAPRAVGPERQGASRRHSRFVAFAKWTLPALAVAMLLLIAVWPRLQAVALSFHIVMPRLDVSDARDLHMMHARYSGFDRENRPFVVTADVARQTPKRDDLVSLDHPKGDLTMASGSWLELNADTGFYKPAAQVLDLFGNVALYQDKGNEFHSSSAHVDMHAGTADGDDPVTGQGPFGDVTAQGFQILDHGATVIFKGHATLGMQPRQRPDR